VLADDREQEISGTLQEEIALGQELSCLDSKPQAQH
jgi:hypothetical protein